MKQLKLFRVSTSNGKFVHYHLSDDRQSAVASIRRIHPGKSYRVKIEKSFKKD